MIVLQQHQPGWQQIYELERAVLMRELQPLLANTYHIGSTAIPNMIAKPIFDIILELTDFNTLPILESRLTKLGYSSLRRNMIPTGSAISQKQLATIGFNLHIFALHDPQIERHLNFRDFLTLNTNYAKQYADLKVALASQFKNDRDVYTSGKNQLIHAIDCAAKLALVNKNIPSSITLSTTIPLIEKSIFTRAKLNHYLFITHYAQYLPEVILNREPGLTFVKTQLRTVEFNHVLDFDYSAADFTQQLDSQSLQLQFIPTQWWDSFCSEPRILASYLQQHNAKKTTYQVWYKLIDNDLSAIPNYRCEQITENKALSAYTFNVGSTCPIEKYYFAMLATLPRSENDAIQFYQLIYCDKIVGYFTLVFYANVVGLYWMETIASSQHFSNFLATLNTTLLKNHRVVVILAKEHFATLSQNEFVTCGAIHSFTLTG